MSNPYQSPQFAGQPSSPIATGMDREKLRRVARYQQWVLYALLANICINIASIAVRQANEFMLSLGVLAVALAIIAVSMIAIFLLANELYNAGIGVLCAILMIVPCIQLITLLIVNGKATSFLQQNGIKVGFMGANPNTI